MQNYLKMDLPIYECSADGESDKKEEEAPGAEDERAGDDESGLNKTKMRR